MLLIPEHLFGSDRPAVFDAAEERWWTYRDLIAQIRLLGENLAGPRRLAFCFCRNDAGTILNYLACLDQSHPVALLDSAMAVEAKRELVARYQPELILATAEEDWIPDGYRFTRSGSTRIWSGEALGSLHPELAVLLSTSGITGSPRFVRLSSSNVRANAESIIAALGITPEDRAIASLPFHYSYGLSVLNTHLLAGASIAVTTEGLVSQRFWETFRQRECTSFAGVPYSYQVLHRLNIDTLEIPTLRTLTQAGGKLNPEIVSRFHDAMQRRNGRFFVMYGQTEATARIAILPAADLPRKLGSAGLAIPGGRFRIKTGNGALTCESGVEGELVYSGPNVMMGYATERADLAEGDTLRGSLETGDLCRLDNEGYLSVIGRMKRDAKIYGLRVNLDEVEAILKAHGPAAVVSGADKLYVYCEYGDPEFLSGLRHKLASRLNINYRAIEFRRLDKLPVHQNGKTDYASLRGMAT